MIDHDEMLVQSKLFINNFLKIKFKFALYVFSQ